MRLSLQRFLLPATIAAAMSMGIVLTAAAADPIVRHEETAVGPLVPGWAILDSLVAIGVLPPEAREAREAREAMVRVRLEQAERAVPGSICRRVANSDDAPTSLVERCREAIQGDSTISPAAACRRIAASAALGGSLVERCRAWLNAEPEKRPGALGICRRIANAESADASLVERCRTILSEHPSGRPTERPATTERPPRSATPAAR